jgi:hypothetical protein
MRPDIRHTLRSFLIELLVYGVLVVGYFFLVLHLLGNWLLGLFEHHRELYAVLALALIVAQGFVLEALTTALLSLIKPRVKEE